MAFRALAKTVSSSTGNAMLKRYLLLMPFIISCRTVPTIIDTPETDLKSVSVMQAQTEIVSTGKDLQASIESVKVITDEAKTTGEIQKYQVQTVIKYVDNSAMQIEKLNIQIQDQTKNIAELEQSRIKDNTDFGKELSELTKNNQELKQKVSFRGKVIFILSSTLAIISVCGIVIAYIKLVN
jgi:hypothetical protein